MTHFEWDLEKDLENQAKHGVPFVLAQHAFEDLRRVIAHDPGHSDDEQRFFCLGRVAGKVLTVRFTYRADTIRIIGAGYWRKGRAIYEKQNQIHG
jgi:uncharacterized protein